MTLPSSMTRRELLRTAAITAAGVALSPALALGSPSRRQLPLITKPIPSTGEELPVIGLGTNAYNVESAAEMAPLREVLDAMRGAGGRVIDTARAYGRSEAVIGELVEGMGARDDFFIVTKMPIRGELRSPEEEIQTSFDDLRVEVIDLMLIHNLYALDELMPALIRAKEAGRFRYIGMSTSVESQYGAQMEAMRRYPLDLIQVDYSIANRSAANEILPLARELGMGAMINVPFGGRGSGAAATFGRVADQELPGWAADFDATTWGQFFLKYVVSHPAVTVAIPGTTRAANMLDNQGGGRGRLPDADTRRRMEEFWDGL